MKPIIEMVAPQPRLPELQFEHPISWEIYPHQHWAIVGANGAGKTLLVDLLQGRYALRSGAVSIHIEGRTSDLIKRIAFKDIHSLADNREGYYQQRFHATENDHVPTVGELLAQCGTPEGVDEVVRQLSLEPLLASRLVYLSSGELRKFLIARALIAKPRFLILDNPFIGLDPPSRALLNGLFDEIATQSEVQIILLLSNPEDIPTTITHILPLRGKCNLGAITREEFLSNRVLQQQLFDTIMPSTIHLPAPTRLTSIHEVTVRLENVSAGYGTRRILEGLNWTVANGQKWALLGRNGSGKSTLLSLVNADHPQSYANTLYLFDKRRGSGESIWDIKERIGFVSPEMHLYYTENVPAIQIVGSGFFDSVGLFRKCSDQQLAIALEWMAVFGIEQLSARPFLTLSSGEQRLVLLARAFVKDPDLLILDEPLHGLDYARKQYVRAVIEAFCSREGKTLIYVTHYLNEIPTCVTNRYDLSK